MNAVFLKNKDGNVIWRYKDLTTGEELSIISVPTRELAENFIKMSADIPMDIENGPLYRFMLYEIGKEEYILNICIHHILADEATFCMIFHKIMDIYSGKEQDWKESSDFFDYIIQKEKQSDVADISWKKLSEGKPLGTITVPETADCDISVVHRKIMLDRNRVERLRKICADNNTSLFAGFMAIFLYTLKLVSDKQRFWVSVPMSDRNVGSFENTFGMFIKKVIVDVSIHDGQPLSETLSVIQKALIEASSQQKNSFASYVRQNGIQQLMNELYVDTVMNFMDSGNDTGYGKLHYVTDKNDVGANNLQLMAELTEESCQCHFYFNENVYSKREIAYIMQEWTKLFQKLTDEPLLNKPSVKIASLYDNGNDSVIGAFLKNVEKTPDADAVISVDETLSYRRFKERVVQFASILSAKGIKYGDAVAVYCVQNTDTIAVIYSLFMIKAIYVPIDRDLPSERASFIIENSGCHCIVSTMELPYSVNVPYVLVNKNISGLLYNKPYADNIERIAYIMYTSGTTGEPKGVPIEERYLVNMCRWYSDTFDIGMKSRSIMVNNYSFDGSLKTIFTPLLFGGCLVLGPDIAFDVSGAVKIISKEKVTHLAGVPSLLKEIINFSAKNEYKDLETIQWTISAGEKFKCNEIQLWSERKNFHSRLANMYGPAECSCIVTSCEVLPQELNQSDIPIGEPINNKRLYLLDETGYPCSVGETGYIWIAGFGTFSGYMGASAEEPHLVKDIIHPDEWMYQSGDMGRLRNDGSIVYIGRCNHQIKISGQRIEAEEMESVLNGYPNISESILVLFENDHYLRTVMFYSTIDHVEMSSDTLREYLAKYFHAGVLPNQFIYLSQFPFNKNGKIDRRQLKELYNVN